MTGDGAIRVRIGVDIGGTFTDIVMFGSDGAVHARKLSSTTEEYSRGIAEGLVALFEAAGLDPGGVDELIHGTTVATNAILQHQGALTGLLTTRGFRDVLEIRRLRIPEMYNLLYEKPRPLVERYLRREVGERITARGEVIETLDEVAVRVEVDYLVRQGVESIAVCLINAYANPVHEHRIAEIIDEITPEVSVSLSSDVLPEVREYERTSTTVINAYVRPVVERYLGALLSRLDRIGVRAPAMLMQSNGGIVSIRTAMARPVQIVESSPAAGVVGARLLAQAIGLSNVITFDMGGTTAKASMVEHGRVRVTSELEVGSHISTQGLNLAGGGYAMKVPVIDISEVGAGGGSILAVDRGGSLQVGPRSAGAVPGPVCYSLGGTEATVTDANVVLGYLNPSYLAGGAVKLDAERARAAVEEQVAHPVGTGLLEAAWIAHVVANASMMGAIKAVSTQRGRDPREFALVAFGGSGPVHGATMARLLEISRVIVPPSPGLFSAYGLLFAEHEHHTVQTFFRPFAELDLVELRARLETMKYDALAELAADGYPSERTRLRWAADLRYVGQGFELMVPMDASAIGPSTLRQLEATFNDEHERIYGHRSPGAPVQFVNLRLTALGLRDSQQPGVSGYWNGAAADADDREPLPDRQAFFGQVGGREGGEAGLLSTPVIRRADLEFEPRHGPLIVEEYDATTVIPPGCTACVDEIGNIVIEIGG